MSEDLTAWFHCGRCATLFRGKAGDLEDRRCTACGEDPVLGLEAEAPSGAAVKTARDPMLRVKRAEVEKPKTVKREVRRQKGGNGWMKLVVVWAIAMSVLAICAKFFWTDDTQQYRGNQERITVSDRDELLIEKEYPKCVQTLSGFISARTPEAKNQFVLNPVDNASRMARFYGANPLEAIDPMSVRGSANGLIKLKNGKQLIETRWTVSDGRTIDATFAQEQGEWRLDWQEFVRYSDEPWALFLAGTEDAEKEFRLFARLREGSEPGSVGNLRVFLHAPVFGHPGEIGEASHEFVFDQLSPEGQMLGEAFKSRASGGRIHASKLPTLDPDNMVRVTVRISRKNGTDGRIFKITRLEACHWLSVSDR